MSKPQNTGWSGKRIEESRGRRSVQEIAKATNIPASTYRTYEKDTEPPFTRLVAIAEVLGKDPYWLAGIKKPASDADQRRAERLTSATTPEEAVKKGRSVAKEDRPTEETYEFLGGFFEVGGNKITIDLIVRGPQERARLGGYGEKGSEDDS